MEERSTFGRGDRGSKLHVAEHPTFRLKGPGFKNTSSVSKLGQLRLPHFAVSFGRDSINQLVPSIYARGNKRPHTGKWKISAVDSLILGNENSENKPFLLAQTRTVWS